jgi:hypothetical protein
VKTRQEELFEHYERFNAEHPEVWGMFVKFTTETVETPADDR